MSRPGDYVWLWVEKEQWGEVVASAWAVGQIIRVEFPDGAYGHGVACLGAPEAGIRETTVDSERSPRIGDKLTWDAGESRCTATIWAAIKPPRKP